MVYVSVEIIQYLFRRAAERRDLEECDLRSVFRRYAVVNVVAVGGKGEAAITNNCGRYDLDVLLRPYLPRPQTSLSSIVYHVHDELGVRRDSGEVCLTCGS